MKSTNQYTSNVLAFDVVDVSKRLVVLVYGLLAYAIGCFGLFWLILGAGAFAPVGLSDWQAESVWTGLLANTGLISLFAVQHTVMAREKFKKWLSQFLPEAAERSTFMLMSGVVTCIIMYFWQSLPGVVWQVQNQIGMCAIYTAYVAGILYLLLATFVTNHFELMGLRQVYLYFRNIPYTPLAFTNKYMYRYSRHPMMLGMLILLWSVPTMTVTRLVLSVLFTLYTMVGIYFEERDLIKNFGATYQKYKQQIATFIPGIY
ncbi:NnrU family protein [Aliiglaciecola sp. CAU 1673]|uniref:methyltransferase family protein n=1 Tax=Aliiglaciecola sp. CAU 1673 TaxID=3032595 RepID=UPI0023D97DC4|nr:NnrU family protein [Aliiglaciecola sp. CAU 1673]MDF2178921.1 NnrU family protein [Aliiglaciecola sp. CAU 1673]